MTFPRVRIVNAAGANLIWCPICQQEKPFGVNGGAWINAHGIPICFYGLCDECALEAMLVETGTGGLVMGPQITNICQTRLLARYPFIEQRLSVGATNGKPENN